MSDTPISFEEEAVLGLAKQVSAGPVNNGDGTYTLTFEFRLENTGNIDLSDIQLQDDLDAVFGTNCDYTIDGLSSSEFTVNPAYDGSTDINLLSGTDELKSWNSGAVYLTVTAGPCDMLGTFANSAEASGTTPTGATVMDTSQEGPEPDPDGDGPGNNSEDTEFEFGESPELGAAKRVTNITNNGDGTYTVGFEVRLENSGDVNLSDIQVVEDLATTFGAADAWSVQSVTSEEFTVNTSFDGDGDINLLAGTDVLLAGNEGAIYIEVLLTPGSTLTGYENSVTASGTSPSGDAITDVSTDGAEPDADGDGSPADDMEATPIDLMEMPSAGIAKRVANITNNGDGSYSVLFEFNIENYGDVAVSNLQVVDDLAAAFPGTCTVTVDALTSDDYTVNPAYTGTGVNDLLLGTDVLEVGDNGAILLAITVDNCGNLGPFANTASLSGTSPGGTAVTDQSVNGSTPDPGQDGAPEEMSDTPISFEEEAVLGLAKQVSTGPVNNGDGTYTLTFEFRLENTGNIDLSDIQLQDDLDAVFGTNCDYTIDGLSSSEFTVNPAYDGSTDINLLSGTDELKSWNSGAVYLTVTAGPCDMLGTFANSAEASGTTPTGATVMDTSQEGPEPDPDGDGPGNNSEDTEFEFDEDAELGAAKRVTNITNNGDGTYTVGFEVKIENSGDVNLSDIQVMEDLATTFGAADAWSVQSITSEEFTVNTSFDGDGDINLLSGTDILLAGNEGAIYIEVLLTPGSTLTGYENSVTASGTSPSGDAITDVSTDGAEPDADGDGSPADDMEATPIDLMEMPSAGIAKRVANITNNGDGSYSVLFEFNIENYGDVAVSNLQVVDNLAAAFPGTCTVTVDALTSDDYTVNAAYDGVGNNNLLLGSDVLEVGDNGAILLAITVDNCGNLGPFANTASLSGTSPGGAAVTDASVNGSTPDPGQDGAPEEMSDTPISFEEEAVLGLAKQVSAGPVNNGDGTYTLTFEFRLENTGNIDLSDIQLQDDLDAVFGTNCDYTIDGLSSSEFTVNPAYDGSADINLLSGTDELKSWNSGAVYLTVTAGPCDMLGTFANSAEASGTTPTGATVMDTSQEGPEPDPDGDGPGNNSEETEFEFGENGVYGVAKRVVADPIPSPNGGGFFRFTYEIRVENLGDVAISNVQVIDDLDDTFLPEALGYTVISLTSEEFNVNPGYNGSSDANMLLGTDVLQPGNEGAIYVTVDVNPGSTLGDVSGPYLNTATATGTSPSGAAIEDDSDSGTDPAGTNENAPGATPGGTDDQTPVSFMVTEGLGLAKRVVSGPINNQDGTFTLEYEIIVQNTGTVDIEFLQVQDNLDETFFGTGAVGGPAVNYVINSVSSEEFVINGSYNGGADDELIEGPSLPTRPNGEVLPAGEEGAISINITVEPGANLEGPYRNSAIGTGVTSTGNNISDVSDSGTNPEGTNPGQPGDTGSDDDPTPVDFEENPVAGLAKRVVTSSNNGDGSYTITYEFNIENFGDTRIFDVQVSDDLSATFDGCTILDLFLTSDDFTVNTAYDGVTQIGMLTGTDTLGVQDKGAILLEVTVAGCPNAGPFENVASLSGTSPAGANILDASVDGSEPDVDGNGLPDESSATPVTLDEMPVLGAAKRISSGPVLDSEGNYELTYEIRIENLGNIDIGNIQVEENLGLTFAMAESWMLLGVESEEFTVNTSIDGTGDINLLAGTDTLEANNEGAIYVSVKVAPGGFSGPYLNQVTATGTSPGGMLLSDLSNNGSEPDPDGDGPGNDSEPTPVTLDCFVDIICPAVTDTLFADNDPGWCRAAVNFPPATIITCAGAPDSLIEFQLIGAGAEGFDTGVWYEGQPSGLMYNVGLTEVLIRASIPSLPGLGYSDNCSFFVQVFDKEDPEILCQDISVPVGANCEYVLTPDRIDAGTTDNCDEAGDLTFELSLDNLTYVDQLIFDASDLASTPITVYLKVTDEADNMSFCTAEVNLIDDTEPTITCPDDRIIYAEENFCAGKVPDITGAVTVDNCSPIDTIIQEPLPGTLFGSAHGDQFDVILTVLDAQGNQDTCTVTLTLQDTIAPVFLNCPQPDIRVNTLPGMCGAFVNFTLPLVEDNCGLQSVMQTDDTGLTSGDMFPVGTSILTFQATDVAGNQSSCFLKVIVNDKAAPSISCPDDLQVSIDAGECGAVVDGLAPLVIDNCAENDATIYRIEDADGTERLSGLNDASGTFFDIGTSTVRYRVQDQPLLLITELTQDLQSTYGGTNPLPGFLSGASADGDYLEVTNFGPAAMDVSCLNIERLHSAGVDTITVPFGTVLAAGEVLTIHFGDGINDSSNAFFHANGAPNLAATESAAYIISHSGTVLDVVVVGNYSNFSNAVFATPSADEWSGQSANSPAGLIRTTYWDTNTAVDFTAAEPCMPGSIGSLNPTLPAFQSNGATTSLQSQQPNLAMCSFTVTVADNELPYCGMLSDALVVSSTAVATLQAGQCIEQSLTFSSLAEVGDLNIQIQGVTEDFGNLDFTLLSPSGRSLELAANICGTNDGWNFTLDDEALFNLPLNCSELSEGLNLRPVYPLSEFDGEPIAGDWVLSIGHNGSLSNAPAVLESWQLSIEERVPFSQADITVGNDAGLCTAEIDWIHPILFDNCSGGTLYVEYINEEDEVIGEATIAPANWGAAVSRIFSIGTTTVSYTLTDAAGNTSTCSFSVNVLDEEAPVITQCPDTFVIQLDPGDCEYYLDRFPEIDDNCGSYSVTYIPDLNTPLEIGTHDITYIVTDDAGNADTCTTTVTVLEHQPDFPELACNDEVNVSLGPDCTREITADMILEGDDYGCYDNYYIVISQGTAPGGGPIPTSPVVTLDEVGQQLIVQVCNVETGECCWGYLNVEFYQDPEFICPADTAVACNGSTDPIFTGEPIVTSCIPGGGSVTYVDEFTDNGDCGIPVATINRTWTVEDGVGNSSSCTQVITIETFDLDDVQFPLDYDNLDLPSFSCIEVANDPSLVSPDSTGFPMIGDSMFVYEMDMCNASYFYEDEIFNICPGSYEILRIWKVRNYCLPVVPGINPRQHIQVIQVLDQDGPDLVCPADTVITANPFNCFGSITLSEPDVLEACSFTDYQMSLSSGSLILQNGQYTAHNLGLGIHTVTINAADGCKRRTECTYQIEVVDAIEPAAVCNDDLNISIGGDGVARVFAEDIDGGSYDNCGIQSIQVRRNIFENSDCMPITESFSDWADYVDFSCCDIGDTVTIELRVTDMAGNENICWLDVEIEDKLNPYCNAPLSRSIACVELPTGFDPADTLQLQQLFGMATATDNCSEVSVQELPPIVNMNNCSVGTIIRRWSATDAYGNTSVNSCQQLITVNAEHEYAIRFPKDYEEVCGTPNPDTILTNAIGCDLLAVSVQDEIFTATGNECYKVLRQYSVINWCEYDGESDPVVISRDEDCDGEPGDEEVWVIRRADHTYVDRDNDELNNNPIFGIKGTSCDGFTNPIGYWKQVQSNGYWQYTQIIKVYDDTPPTVSFTGDNTFCSYSNGTCTSNTGITFEVEEDCSNAGLNVMVLLDINNDGSTDMILDTSELIVNGISYELNQVLPIGTHRVEVQVDNGCGLNNAEETTITVIDCGVPPVVCIDQLAAELTPLGPDVDFDGDGTFDQGGIAIPASALITSELFDCSSPLTFSVNRVGDAADIYQEEIRFICQDTGQQMVEVWVWDAFGNSDFCVTAIDVQDNQGICSNAPLATVAGILETEYGDGLENADVSISGGQSSSVLSMSDGSYTFNNLEMGYDYTITPYHNQQPLNGVSTADLIFISRHILGVEPLDSPYKMIAADANNTGSITALDQIQIRKMILGIDTSFPNNTSWRFIDATHLFSDPDNPWNLPFPESVSLNDLNGSVYGKDFIAVKTGDVTGDAEANELTKVESRFYGPSFRVSVPGQELVPGSVITLPFRADASEVKGFQGTLDFNDQVLELVEVRHGLLSQRHMAQPSYARGMITFSWNDEEAEVQGVQTLFELVFRVQAAGELQELIEINSGITPKEAYHPDITYRDIELVFEHASQKQGPELYQNFPNPFTGETSVGFYLPRRGEAIFTIFNAQGEAIYRYQDEFTEGIHKLVLNRGQLGQNGFFTYTLQFEGEIMARKMIMLE
jgi:hypothetical protein